MRSEGRWRLRRAALAGVILHALVLLAAPYEHHDLVCHLKTPQHCSSCVSSQPGPDSRLPRPPGAAALEAAGWVHAPELVAAGALLAVPDASRSPPPLA
jgi:hypothetical protein